MEKNQITIFAVDFKKKILASVCFGDVCVELTLQIRKYKEIGQ